MKKRKGKLIQLELPFESWEDEGEVWRDIANYEGLYQASNLGRIKSLDKWVNGKDGSKRFVKGKILKQYVNRCGYSYVILSNNGNMKNCSVHRLVWEAFSGEIPEGMEINHISECKQDNRICNLNLLSHKANLNWGTHNERVAKANRLVQRNDKKKSKPVIQKTLQGEVIKIWPSTREIERELGHSGGNICECCNGGYFSNSRGKWINITQAYGYIWKYYTEEAV